MNQWSIDGLSRRLRRQLVWRYLLARAASNGIEPGSLGRIHRYLSVSLGLDEPAYTDPLQRPRAYLAGLAAKPIHEPAAFPWTAQLEREFETIGAELSALRATVPSRPHPQDLAEHGNWNVHYFYLAGRRFEQNHRACPRTSAIIDTFPGARYAGQVYFSVLTEGTHVMPHCGPTNTRLRCHFGLVVPKGCRLRVGNETHTWQPGRCLVFDDSFEHEVWISGGERIVLIADFWHPEMTAAERWAVEQMTRISGRARKYLRKAWK